MKAIQRLQKCLERGELERAGAICSEIVFAKSPVQIKAMLRTLCSSSSWLHVNAGGDLVSDIPFSLSLRTAEIRAIVLDDMLRLTVLISGTSIADVAYLYADKLAWLARHDPRYRRVFGALLKSGTVAAKSASEVIGRLPENARFTWPVE